MSCVLVRTRIKILVLGEGKEADLFGFLKNTCLAVLGHSCNMQDLKPLFLHLKSLAGM